MIIVGIKTRGNQIRLLPVAFSRDQMAQIGSFGLEKLKRRVSFGIGSNDAAMPGLQVGYQRLKARRVGSSLRDLKFTGRMLDDLKIQSVSESSVRMDITTALSRIKARTNEQRSPWLSFSPSDEAAIYAEASRQFRGNIVAMLTLGDKRGPIWANPSFFRGSRVGKAA